MDRYLEEQTSLPTQIIENTQDHPLVIEYADLVGTVQLSVARQIGIEGSCEASTIDAALSPFDTCTKHEVLSKIGQHFDEALVNFVMAAVITRRTRPIIIIADETEGIDGYLPWQTQLEKRVAHNEANGLLTGAQVHIERTSKIEHTAVELGHYACERPALLATS